MNIQTIYLLSILPCFAANFWLVRNFNRHEFPKQVVDKVNKETLKRDLLYCTLMVFTSVLGVLIGFAVVWITSGNPFRGYKK